MKAVVLLMAVLILAGCNTMKGLGEDVRQGGEAIEKAADK